MSVNVFSFFSLKVKEKEKPYNKVIVQLLLLAKLNSVTNFFFLVFFFLHQKAPQTDFLKKMTNTL